MDIDVDSVFTSVKSISRGADHVNSRPETLTGDGSLLIPVRACIQGQCLEFGGTSIGWTQVLDSLATNCVSMEFDTNTTNTEDLTVAFDTVVAACRPTRLNDVAEFAHRAIRDDGSLLLAINGWAEHLRTDRHSPTQALTALPRGNVWYIRRTLRRAGFEKPDLYGVFPSIAEPKFIYPLEDEAAIKWFIENRLTGWMNVAARTADYLDIFGAGQPGYLAICDRAPKEGAPKSAVTRISYNRVVTFELDRGEVARVRKESRPSAGDETIRREHQVLNKLYKGQADVPDAVMDTLPAGSMTSSATGVVRLEAPVMGVPIGTRLDTDPAAVRAVLDTAFEWLAMFQQAYRGESVVREPAELFGRAQWPPIQITDPPALNAPVHSFVSPCHGDFHPWNVWADDTRVTDVIDWEYATACGDPAVDPAHFLLYVCDQVSADFETGFKKLCASDTPYSTAVRAALDRYCDRVGLSRRAIVTAFLYAHVYTLRTLHDLGQPPAYRVLSRKYEPRLATITANFEKVMKILGDGNS